MTRRPAIQRAHVLVHPSALEGGAHVIMEAVRSGTPVLASRVPATSACWAPTTPATSRMATPALADLLLQCRACARPRRRPAGPARTMRPARAAVRARGRTRALLQLLQELERPMNAHHPTVASAAEPRLTSLSHGGGCGCKIAPGVLAEILKGTAGCRCRPSCWSASRPPTTPPSTSSTTSRR
jgi:hypothetical protein